jgi:hypothetical protein
MPAHTDSTPAPGPAAATASFPRALWWLLGGLLLFLVSPAVRQRGFYLAEWFDPGQPWLAAGLTRWVLLSAALAALFAWRRIRTGPVLGAIVAGSILLCAVRLFATTGGVPLYRDDHPSMMYRLWLFLQTFPQTVNYSPFWNGGVLDSTPVSSGIQGVGLLLWPLWKLLPVHEAYTPAVGLLYLLVLPALAAAAARLAGGDRLAAGVAALLGLGISRHFFLWALHFGTVGASLAGAFVMPTAAALYRVVVLGRRERWLALVLTASLFFTIQWPPGLLMLACLGLGVLACPGTWNLRTLGFLAGCGAVALLLDIPALRAILDKTSSPLSFAIQQAPSPADAEAAAAAPGLADQLAAGLRTLGAHAVEAHPVLVFLGFGGALLAGRLAGRRFFAPALLGFALLGTLGPALRPNLQLERLVLPGLFAAVVPAALVAGRVLGADTRGARAVRAALLALLALGGVAVARIHGNRTTAPYVTLNDQVRGVIEAVEQRQPAGGRVLFAGSMVHALGRGHVAYLPVLTDTEMMACDYYHFPPRMVEYNYPPRAHRTNEAAMAEFLDAYDVTHIVTFRRDWLRYFSEHTNRYEQVGQVDEHAIYRVARAPARFRQGRGRITAGVNRLEVELADNQAEAVIKYNWQAGLHTPPPAVLFPFEARPGLTLIGIRPHGAERVVITYEH